MNALDRITDACYLLDGPTMEHALRVRTASVLFAKRDRFRAALGTLLHPALQAFTDGLTDDALRDLANSASLLGTYLTPEQAAHHFTQELGTLQKQDNMHQGTVPKEVKTAETNAA